MKNVLGILLAFFPLGAPQPALSQQAAGPPAVLRIFREDVKEGKAAAHEKTEAAFMQAAAKVKYSTHILGLTAFTGTSHAVFLEGYDTFASVADSEAELDKPEFAALDAADAELRTSHRSQLAVYRPDLSYAVNKINLPKTRFFSIETVRIREGQLQTYTQLVKMLIDAAGKSADPQPVTTYEVVSGAPNSTFLVLEPLESLKAIDEELRHDPAFFQAMGEEGMKRYSQAVSEAIASEESILYAVNPQMSYAPQEWITSDPDFWTPKPVETKPAPAKSSPKTAKKPASK